MRTLTLITAFLAALTTTSFAQTDNPPRLHSLPTQKGTSFVGSNLLLAGAASSDLVETNTIHYNIGLSPRYGRFVTNNFALGLDLNANLDGLTHSPYRSLATSVGVFGRYYFGNAVDKHNEQNKLRLFVEGGVAYGHIFARFPDNGINPGQVGRFDYNTYNFHVMPGFNYFLSRNVAIETGLNFSRSHTATDNYLRDNFSNLSLNVGLQFFFGKK